MKTAISAAVGAALLATTAQAAPVLWDISSGGNGHYYEVRAADTWANGFADAAASEYEGLQGYLVTLTSAAEVTFVFNNVTSGRYWAGGSDAETEGLWKWVNGPEMGLVFRSMGATPPGAYANWAFGEPNQHNGNPENYVLANWSASFWNDAASAASFAYVVEYGGIRVSNGVPEPAAWVFMILGFAAAGAMLRRSSSRSPARAG